jgi:hypothetical protein
LIEQYERKGSLSAKQFYWVDTLTTRAEEKKTQAPAAVAEADVGDFSGVIQLFNRGLQHLTQNRMKIRLQDENGTPVILTMPSRGKYAGSIYVTDGKPYGSNKFYGTVSPEGKFIGSKISSTSIVALLQAFATDPAKTAAEYGRLTGNCTFCAKGLTDSRSLTVGYGPICANHFGLTWGEKEQRSFSAMAPKHAIKLAAYQEERYHALIDAYENVVDSDNIGLIKPVADELRHFERSLGLAKHSIAGSVYDG